MHGGTEIPVPLTETSQEWENARTHLAKAIETYVGATTALAATTTSYPLRKFHSPTLALENELESISTGLLKLDKARVILAKTRNTQYSTISRLPSELLASIFQIVVDAAYPRNIVDSASYANPAATLVSVCSRWRQVALGAGSLWSCVVLSYENPKSYEGVSASAQMQLERTLGFPIDMFLSRGLFQPLNVGSDDDTDNPPAKQNLRPTPDLIKPYLKQLRSLTARLYQPDHIESILECLLEHGTAGSLSRLEILGTSPHHLFHRADPQTLERLDKHLQSVRILSLHGVAFDWKCAAFQQLDELLLNELHASCCPNVTQLAAVLSASPCLRSLRLTKIRIYDEVEHATPSPIELDYLEHLTLDRLDDSGFCRVASVLSLGRQIPDLVMIDDFNSPAKLGALRLFAKEKAIKSLRLVGLSRSQPLLEILESLPHIEYLTLGGLGLEQSDFDALIHRNNVPPVPPSLPPAQTAPTNPHTKLKALILLSCIIVFDQTTFKEAILKLALDIFYLRESSIMVRTESQGEFGVPKLVGIDATTELGTWFTENLSGKVLVE